ncbi:MAG: hypothetical protein OXO49_05690 [Gammaproteobacteria bacterium]|nr:hypothetical protein [Gammaproteobacteria bacterium]MDE0252594.1 hypothetical protein [Gammaproteobacteria bacterium]MDE0403480.1 hypothetical protein [Gammaproteobacteria bacterium]
MKIYTLDTAAAVRKLELADCTPTLAEAIVEICAAKDANFATKSDIERVSSDLKDVKSDLKDVKSDLKEVNLELGEVRTEIGEMKSELSNVKKDVQVLNTGLCDVKNDVQILNAGMVKVKEDIGILQSSVSVLCDHLMQLSVNLKYKIIVWAMVGTVSTLTLVSLLGRLFQ